MIEYQVKKMCMCEINTKDKCTFKINFVILLFYTYSYTSYNPKFEKKSSIK